MFSELEITGRARTHIVQFHEPRFAAHKVAAEAFMDMRSEAHREGIILHPVSSFRDFNTQLRIWNQKFSGKKPLYTRDGQKRNIEPLCENEIIKHILDWTALPGTSRHHWGTDIDVIDKSTIAKGYRVKLLPEEIEAGGVFHTLHCWLNENIHRFDFFQPYKTFRGGMFPEPWQISFAPISLQAIESLTPELLSSLIKTTTIGGKEKILEMIPELFDNHILNIDQPENSTPRYGIHP